MMTVSHSKADRLASFRSSWFPGFLSGFLAGVSLTAVLGIFLAMVFAGSTLIGAPSTPFANDETRPMSPRDIGVIRKDMKAFIKNSKQDEDENLQIGSIVDLCQLHREIVSDPRFESSRSLQSLRAQTAQRLKTYKKSLQLKLTRYERKLAKHRLKAPPQSPNENDMAESLVEPSTNEDDGNYLDDAMAASMFELMDTTGGPAQLLNYLPGNFAPPWDHGEDLVRLIESTIQPSSWRNRGGNGVIEYYRPLRVLVVSATTRVHDDTTNLLRNLRWMDR